MIFKCRNCGGNVIYSPDKKGMYCPFCDSEHTEENHSMEEKYSGEIRQESQEDLRTCPDCGGEMPVEEYTSALKCPYCDNYMILNERVEGEYAPSLIIPFQYSKDMVKKLMRTQFRKCVFAPVDFLSEVRLNSMEGNYVPFWLYDYDTNCEYRGEGTRVRTWTSGETQYTETSFYDIYRNMDIQYLKIPVDASVKMPDDIMDCMEPYQYNQLVKFQPQFLSGFNGEKYNVASGQAEPRARTKMQESARQLIKQSVTGYGNVKDRFQDIRIKEQNVDYCLLPVWAYLYRYKEKDFPFYINGQTGKIVGETPVSAARVWAYGLTLWGTLTAILGMLWGIISLW